MNVSSCYRIGRITKPHGIKGNVSVFIDREAPANFAALDTVFAEKKKRLIPLTISHIVTKGDRAYIQFEDINSIEEAESLRQCDLYLPKESRPEPGEGEFYSDEVIGFEVDDERVGTLGTVKDVSTAGPTRLLVVESENKEILIPENGPFIKRIDREARLIRVDLPEGFLEI